MKTILTDALCSIREDLSPAKGAVCAAGGLLAALLGGADFLLKTLIFLAALDYFTGVLAAIHTRNLSSEIGYRGIIKKVMCFVLVAVAWRVERLAGDVVPLREMVILFFAANEGLSILENAARIGLPLPRALEKVLVQLKGKSEGETENGKDDATSP